ncbi:ROK family glucokinase [Halalkalibacter urbisdiaboli]|uniref:ROK family glucokinase n=1 Tax=Halalkalibacter urbisdiaboli TaxID=1960589 RepID=UPI000B44DCD1|nr:ROK family glucokinase [Halalkalibacter urbisdiaboli]
MENKWLVGVDIGGTTIKMAFVTNNGDIVDKWEIPTNTENGGINITSDIAKAINEKLQNLGESRQMLGAIGLGAPAFIEMDTGFVYEAVNIGWKNFALKEILEKETGLPVKLDNDANIAALGEMWRGAGDGAKNLLCITLGTGVGGGIIANGQILHGINGMAGEVGHITSVPEGGAPCNCGKTGCLETIASATGMVRLAMEQLSSHPQSALFTIYKENGKLTTKDIFASLEKGDTYANEVVETTAYHLGLALANLANAFNPHKIVIGGGVSKAGNLILDPLERHFKKFALKRVAEGAEFKIATLGNDAGVIGGAWIAKQIQ